MSNPFKEVVIIGAGKIASSLAPAIIDSGATIPSVVSRNLTGALNFSYLYGIDTASDDLSDISGSYDLAILSVPDDKIKEVAEQIANTNESFKGKTFIHLSGLKTSEELISLKEKGAQTASFHIMQTFPTTEIQNISECYTAIQSRTETTRDDLFLFARAIGLKPFFITAENKIYYHLMGIFASNFLIANYQFISDLADLAGPDLPDPVDLLQNLTQTTLNNLKMKGITQALSGPIERGDLQTVKNHIQALDEKPNVLEHYNSSSKAILKTAENKGSLSPETIDKFKEVLSLK